MTDEFVLDKAENPHPVMLRGAQKARAAVEDAKAREFFGEKGAYVLALSYWDGYVQAMADATGETTEAIIRWVSER